MVCVPNKVPISSVIFVSVILKTAVFALVANRAMFVPPDNPLTSNFVDPVGVSPLAFAKNVIPPSPRKAYSVDMTAVLIGLYQKPYKLPVALAV